MALATVAMVTAVAAPQAAEAGGGGIAAGVAGGLIGGAILGGALAGPGYITAQVIMAVRDTMDPATAITVRDMSQPPAAIGKGSVFGMATVGGSGMSGCAADPA